MADSLRVDDNVVFLAPSAVVDNPVNQSLLIAVIALREKDILRAVSNAAPQCDVSGVAPHNLHDAAPLMGCGCIANLINCFHGRVDSRVKTNGIIGTGNIQVNGSRKADCIDTQGGQLSRTSEGTVSSDDHHSVNAMLAADISALLLAFRCGELLTSCRVKDGAAPVDDVRHAGGLHVHDFLLQQACVSAHDALYLKALIDSSPYNRADGRVHSRRVASAGKYSNGFHCLCHSNLPPCIKHIHFFCADIALNHSFSHLYPTLF